jgi:hypothetical protein
MAFKDFYKNFYVAESGCWIWETVKPGSRGHYAGMNATHYSLLKYTGQVVPKGLGALHTCDNPSCINPGHLYIGDQKLNMQDRVARNRSPRNELKLKRHHVEELRRMKKECGVPATKLAKIFGISYSHCKNICNGNRWSRV